MTRTQGPTTWTHEREPGANPPSDNKEAYRGPTIFHVDAGSGGICPAPVTAAPFNDQEMTRLPFWSTRSGSTCPVRLSTATTLQPVAGCVARGAVPASVVWLPLLIVPQILFTAGLCWILAATGVFVRDLGYLVLEATDGPSALRLVGSRPVQRIDLLFSDLVLPNGMNGHLLAEQIRQVYPGLPVLYTTGYSPESSLHVERHDRDFHDRRVSYARPVYRAPYFDGYFGLAPAGWQGYYWHGNWYRHRRMSAGLWIYF